MLSSENSIGGVRGMSLGKLMFALSYTLLDLKLNYWGVDGYFYEETNILSRGWG